MGWCDLPPPSAAKESFEWGLCKKYSKYSAAFGGEIKFEINDVLPHFAKQNEAKRRLFKITLGGVSRQMMALGLFTQPPFKI